MTDVKKQKPKRIDGKSFSMRISYKGLSELEQKMLPGETHSDAICRLLCEAVNRNDD